MLFASSRQLTASISDLRKENSLRQCCAITQGFFPFPFDYVVEYDQFICTNRIDSVQNNIDLREQQLFII